MNKLITRTRDDEEYWISVSDMMAGLMMVFLLITVIYFFNIDKLTDQAEATQERICAKIDNLKRQIDRQGQVSMSVCENGLLVSFQSKDDNDSMFDLQESDLKPDFEKALNDFFRDFMEIIIEHKNDISELRIEGHTSSEWEGAPTAEAAYIKNTKLSQDRSRKVLEHSFNLISNDTYHNDTYHKWMLKNLTAHGMSSSRLVYEDGAEDRRRSRRVEFRIQTNLQDRILSKLRNKDIK